MLQQHNRLRSKKEFARVYQAGSTVQTPLFRIKVLANTVGHSRIGVVIPNKILKLATMRNKKKRQVRAVLEESGGLDSKGLDVILLGKAGIGEASFEDIESSVKDGLKKIGFLGE